jgi:hypothetical protein
MATCLRHCDFFLWPFGDDWQADGSERTRNQNDDLPTGILWSIHETGKAGPIPA